jgi:hypothetical protein
VPKNASKFAGWSACPMKRLTSSYMKVTNTSQLRPARMLRTAENGAPVPPKGSMKAKVGGSLTALRP